MIKRFKFFRSASIEIDGTIEANTKEDAERAIEEMLEIGGSRVFETGGKRKDRRYFIFEIRDVSQVDIESMD